MSSWDKAVNNKKIKKPIVKITVKEEKVEMEDIPKDLLDTVSTNITDDETSVFDTIGFLFRLIVLLLGFTLVIFIGSQVIDEFRTSLNESQVSTMLNDSNATLHNALDGSSSVLLNVINFITSNPVFIIVGIFTIIMFINNSSNGDRI